MRERSGKSARLREVPSDIAELNKLIDADTIYPGVESATPVVEEAQTEAPAVENTDTASEAPAETPAVETAEETKE